MEISNSDNEILLDFTGGVKELVYQKASRLPTLKEVFCKVLNAQLNNIFTFH